MKKPTTTELFLRHHQEKLGVECYSDDPLERAIELLNHYEKFADECGEILNVYMTDLLDPETEPEHQEAPLEISIRKHAQLLQVRPKGGSTEFQAISLLNLYRDLWCNLRRFVRLEARSIQIWMIDENYTRSRRLRKIIELDIEIRKRHDISTR